MYSNQSFTYL